MTTDNAPQQIPVDKNVPRPLARTTSAKYPFRKMEIGDSFAVPAEIGGKPRSMCSKFPGRRFSSRAVTEDGKKLVRIWRVA